MEDICGVALPRVIKIFVFWAYAPFLFKNKMKKIEETNKPHNHLT